MIRELAAVLVAVSALAPTWAHAQEPEAEPTPAPENAPATPADPAAAPTGESAAPAAEEPAPRPQLRVTDPVRDLGRVQRGERAEIVFTLENLGDATLKIKSAQPACGCTVASFDKEIAAGASGTLRATLDTSTLEGPVAKSVTVISNDPQQPRTVLTIKADVVHYVRVAPAFARVLQVRSLEPARTAVNLWSEDGTDLVAGPARADADWIRTHLERAQPDELHPAGPPQQWRLEIELAPEAPLGPLTGSVVVATNHPRQREIEVPLSGFVRPLLTTAPPAADFGALGPRAADPRQFVLKLFNFGKEPVEVRAAATDLPFVGVAVEPDEPGRRYRLRLTLAPDAPKGKFEGTLRVETDSTEMPVVEVPVTGKVR
jgi:hypothetical protein